MRAGPTILKRPVGARRTGLFMPASARTMMSHVLKSGRELAASTRCKRGGNGARRLVPRLLMPRPDSGGFWQASATSRARRTGRR